MERLKLLGHQTRHHDLMMKRVVLEMMEIGAGLHFDTEEQHLLLDICCFSEKRNNLINHFQLNIKIKS